MEVGLEEVVLRFLFYLGVVGLGRGVLMGGI